MKKVLINLGCLALSVIVLSSCATIFGSTNYSARIEVVDHGKAKITQNEQVLGTGFANAIIKRKDAQNLTFVIKEKGCENQTFNYNTATLRGWSIAGTVTTWGLIGVIVDGANGSWWKPNVNDTTIEKKDYKNYTYKLNYTGCEDK